MPQDKNYFADGSTYILPTFLTRFYIAVDKQAMVETGTYLAVDNQSMEIFYSQLSKEPVAYGSCFTGVKVGSFETADTIF